MTTTTAPGLLRRFDPINDSDAVVKLVEESFNLKNDPEGQAMLRQMRAEGHRWPTNSALQLATGGTDGFVWEVQGQIVGNITLIPYQSGFTPIILIANVAVKNDFQGQGIGTELTRHAIRVARQRPFSEIWLQVRSDNIQAIHIYQALGFRHHSSLTQWRKSGRQQSSLPNYRKYEGVLFRARLADWRFQESWLTKAYPKQTRWYADFDFNLLKPFAWLNPLNWVDLMNVSTRCLRSAGKLLAAVTCYKNPRRSDRLWLAVEKPNSDDSRVATLLGAFLEQEWDGQELMMEYPVGWAANSISNHGFIAKRHLDWMKFRGK